MNDMDKTVIGVLANFLLLSQAVQVYGENYKFLAVVLLMLLTTVVAYQWQKMND